ncbi:MAG: HD domain-containing protein, partial [Nitrospirae bacterium]|nr:HD domain-containing protein [Nitrospirota bacterium]
MLSEKQKLTQIINLGLEIAKFKDVDLVLERILTAARQFVNAEAGSFYIREGERLKFSCTQNELLQKRLPAGKKLIYSTFSIPINSESIAGHVAYTGEMLNIADVYKLPADAPFSFDREYDEISGYRTQSVLTFPLTTCQGGIIGVLQLINAKDDKNRIRPFNREDEPLVGHFANNAAVALERAQLTRAIILRVIKMAELRDPKETGPHVNRVASYAVEIYESWASRRGIPKEEIELNKDTLRIGAMLHDVGKVAISDMILKKPARLEPEEYETMKRHTHLGARLFSDVYSDFDEAASLIALNHHERWDGNGYPGHINPA